MTMTTGCSDVSNRDLYKLWEMQPDQGAILPCPVCGSRAQVWQFAENEYDPVQRVVMCENGEAFGPQDGLTNEGCLLFMPPDQFYRATAREAVNYWNQYAVALIKQRLERGPS